MKIFPLSVEIFLKVYPPEFEGALKYSGIRLLSQRRCNEATSY